MMRLSLTTVAFLVLGNLSHAQRLSPFERSTHAFRAIIGLQGITPWMSDDEALAHPARTVVVLLGKADALDHRFANGQLLEFIVAGGAILVATDRDTEGTQFSQQLETWVEGPPLICNRAGQGVLYRNILVNCPLLQPSRRTEIRSKIDVLKGLRNVATNRPASLRQIHDQVNNKQRCVIELPDGCDFEYSRGRFMFQVRPMFGIAEQNFGNGKYMIMADHSVFINSMLLQTDNDNHLFARNVINWLSDDGKRDRILLYDDGEMKTDLNSDLSLRDPPLPHPDALGPMVDRLVENLESENFFNELVGNWFSPRHIIRSVLLGLTTLAAAFALYRLVAGRFRRDPKVARLPDTIDDLAGTTQLPDDWNAAARELARHTLTQALGEEPRQRPIVDASGILARRSWTKSVNLLWQWGYGNQAPAVIASKNLESLATAANELLSAIEKGELTLRSSEDAE